MATIKISFMLTIIGDTVAALVVDTDNEGSWFNPDPNSLNALVVLANSLDPRPTVNINASSITVMYSIEEG